MRNIFITLILLLSGLLGLLVSIYHHPFIQKSNDAPFIKTFHQPAWFVQQLQGDPDAGRKIFKEFCASCHASEPVIHVNAPRITDKKRWKTLSKIGKKKLLQITLSGVGAMPARGGCFECSDEELSKTIDYILRPRT